MAAAVQSVAKVQHEKQTEAGQSPQVNKSRENSAAVQKNDRAALERQTHQRQSVDVREQGIRQQNQTQTTNSQAALEGVLAALSKLPVDLVKLPAQKTSLGPFEGLEKAVDRFLEHAQRMGGRNDGDSSAALSSAGSALLVAARNGIKAAANEMRENAKAEDSYKKMYEICGELDEILKGEMMTPGEESTKLKEIEGMLTNPKLPKRLREKLVHALNVLQRDLASYDARVKAKADERTS